jgi:redox-sensitive bicupin YhaK (pirin superfamily)
MKTPSSIMLLAILLSAISGCSYFHKESPQQQYTEALMRGNSMQASQIWLNMSADDRMKFARGEGVTPDEESTKKNIEQMMTNHQNQSGEGPSNAEQIEEQMPTPLGASIRDLPTTTQSSAPAN